MRQLAVAKRRSGSIAAARCSHDSGCFTPKSCRDIVRHRGSYAVMALARNTQSKTVVKMDSGKSAFAGERSSQRNCLSNSS